MLARRSSLAIAIAGLLAMATTGAAQEALVLSTGASKGLAHAGVVAGLEERGYDPDLVVGSSMGAVIGGLYASGHAPEEIVRLLEAVDWRDIFKPMPLLLGPGRSVRLPLLRLGLGLAPLEVDRGFAPDWRVNRLTVRLFFDAGARSRGDFDRLARRFRAVTTDLETGEEVVIARGDLARAVRASLGVPGFFSPVEWDDRFLADGGIVNYLPISVARELGAETIIAADVSRPPPWVERKDPLALAGRGVGLLMRNALRDTLPDVLIRPRLDPDASGAVFPATPDRHVAVGLEAALAVLPPGSGTTRERALPPPPSSLSALVVEAPDASVESLTRRVFRDAAPGPYDASRVLEAMDRLYATGLVAGVWPRVEEAGEAGIVAGGAAGDGAQTGLAPGDEAPLTVRVDPVPRMSISGAVGYDNDRGGRGWVEIQRRVDGGGAPVELMLAASLNGLDRWVDLSSRIHVPAFVPVMGTVGGHARETDVRIFDGDPATGDAEVWRAGGWLGGEYRRIFPDRIAALVLQAEWVNRANGTEGVSVGPRVHFSTGAARTQVVGFPAEAEAELRFGEVGYGYAAARGSLESAWRGFRAAAVADLAVTEKDAPLDVRPSLGDDHAVPGFTWGQERGRARAVVGADVAYPIIFNGAARLKLRAGAAPATLEGFGQEDAWVGGAALEGVWTAPFGPIVVGAGANTRGGQRLDVSVGASF